MPTHEQRPGIPYQCVCGGWSTNHASPTVDEEFAAHVAAQSDG